VPGLDRRSQKQITAADCAEVSKAISAVELRTRCAVRVCAAAQSALPAMQMSTAGWRRAGHFLARIRHLTTCSRRRFRVGSTFGGQAVDSRSDAARRQDWGGVLAPDQTQAARLVTIPASCSSPVRTFPTCGCGVPRKHLSTGATEPGWDGGNLKVSVNGGGWQLLPPSAYTFNGTTSTCSAEQKTNPLAGQPARSGNNAGTANGGSWGHAHVNLADLCRRRDHVRLRWEFGTDVCSGRTGWYLDNVNVFGCTPKVPSISINDPVLAEGDAGKRVVFFTVSLDTPTIRAVSVNYSIADGTALHGDDFMPTPDGVIVIPAGATSATIGVTLKGDTTFEPNEEFYANLSGAVNATIGKAQGVATIVNDDVVPTPEP
jgi:hypothetical protein